MFKHVRLRIRAERCIAAFSDQNQSTQRPNFAKANRALGNCDRMHEQTDFSTFSPKKARKGRYSPKNAIKGERNRLFQKAPKGAKRASTFGKGLPSGNCSYLQPLTQMNQKDKVFSPDLFQSHKSIVPRLEVHDCTRIHYRMECKG